MSNFTETKNVVLGNRVAIQPDDQLEQTKGGLYIPDSANVERPMRGTVVAVGDGEAVDGGEGGCVCKKKPPVIVGDRVLYCKYAGTDFKVGDTQYLIVSGDDILMIIETAQLWPNKEQNDYRVRGERENQ